MMRKMILALAATASLGAGAVTFSTPAEAGFWYHGSYVERERGWEHYRCHWEVRVREFMRHGHLMHVRERVRVCD